MNFQTYCVTDAVAFPSLPLPPNSFIVLNGLVQTPGVDYDVINGTTFRFRSNANGVPFISNGDRITVVTLG